MNRRLDRTWWPCIPAFSKDDAKANRAEVGRTSRERYTTPRTEIETRIARFLESPQNNDGLAQSRVAGSG